MVIASKTIAKTCVYRPSRAGRGFGDGEGGGGGGVRLETEWGSK